MWSGETLFLKLAGEYDQACKEYNIFTTESTLTRRLVSVLSVFALQTYYSSSSAPEQPGQQQQHRQQHQQQQRRQQILIGIYIEFILI